MASEYWLPGPFSVTGSGAFTLDRTDGFSADPQVKEALYHAAGRVEPSFTGIIQEEPMISFAAYDLLTMFSKFGASLNPLFFPTGSTYTGIEQWMNKFDETALRLGGANDAKLASVAGVLVPTQISVRNGESAKMILEFHCSDDGVNAPWIPTFGATQSFVPVADEEFRTGPVYINSSTKHPNVTGWSLAFNWKIEKKHGPGAIYPKANMVINRDILLTIETDNPANLTTLGLTGLAQGATASDFYLRAGLINGQNVPNVTTSHLRIRFANAAQGFHYMGQTQGGHLGIMQHSFMSRPLETASQVAITATVAGVAIPGSD